jgi:hypothetical protein
MVPCLDFGKIDVGTLAQAVSPSYYNIYLAPNADRGPGSVFGELGPDNANDCYYPLLSSPSSSYKTPIANILGGLCVVKPWDDRKRSQSGDRGGAVGSHFLSAAQNFVRDRTRLFLFSSPSPYFSLHHLGDNARRKFVSVFPMIYHKQ